MIDSIEIRNGRKPQNCRWNFDAIYRSFRDVSVSGLGGHIAISGCSSLSQSLSLNSPWLKTPGCSWKRTHLLFFYLTRVGFYTPSATRVRKNRSAIRGLIMRSRKITVRRRHCRKVVQYSSPEDIFLGFSDSGGRSSDDQLLKLTKCRFM